MMSGDPLAYVRVTSIVYAFGIAIAFAEKLHCVRDYNPDGWFAWRVLGFDRDHCLGFRRFRRHAPVVFGRGGMTIGLGIGVAGALAIMLASPGTPLFATGAAATMVASLMSLVRCSYGGDGAQQLNLLVGTALFLGFNPWVHHAVGSICLVAIAVNACFAYFSSGVAKLLSPIWMRGDPLVGIFATKAYGSPLGLRLVTGAARLRRPLGVAMVMIESAFPIAVFGPWWVMASFLAWGVAFHFANAILMGLNSFFWAFLATYPAIAYAWWLLHH